MKIKYELPDDMKTDVLAELKNHLAMNGYNAEWQENKSFVVSEEMTGYVDTILSDRGISGYNSEPLVKWYDDFEMENRSEEHEEEDAYFTFLVGEIIENEGEEGDKTYVYMDMRGYIDDDGKVIAYPYDDTTYPFVDVKSAYLHEDDGVTEWHITIPENIYKKIKDLTEEAIAEEYDSKGYETVIL